MPFHSFLAEWQRRFAAEASKANSDESKSATPQSANQLSNALESDSSLALSTFPDVFLGNAHLQSLSSQVLSDLGPGPFELNRLSAEPQNPTVNGLKMFENGRLWMGNADHVSHLHFDAHHGLLITLFGHKRVTLFEPLSHLDIIEKSEGNHARFNPLQKPLGSSAQPIVLDLFAGDALLIPLYWWHLVESISSSIAINYWCYPDFEASKMKFGKLWPFARQACVDHIKASLGSSSGARRSKWSLLTTAKTLEIVEALLRFKLPPSALASPDPSLTSQSLPIAQEDHQKLMDTSSDAEDSELNSVRSWAQLLELASAQVRSVISENEFF